MKPIFQDFSDTEAITRVAVRLLVALLLGGMLGFQRHVHGKEAGLRTIALVALGGALFILVPEEAGIGLDHLSRPVQGIVVGIGFLGGGTILKLQESKDVKGLTTAATIWVAAALGMSVGFGLFWPAVAGTALSLVVLAVLGRFEHQARGS